MPLFVISWMDKPDSLELRMANREAHLAYAAKHHDQVRLGGPFLGPDGQMAGSMMVLEMESLEAAQAFHDADPYKLAGLIEHSDVRPWRITLSAGIPAT
jgi:uncharacterized protein YciI